MSTRENIRLIARASLHVKPEVSLMRGSGGRILHHWALGKLNSMGSWCTKLSNYMGCWCSGKLNSMGGWVKKECSLPSPGVFFWNSPHLVKLYLFKSTS